MTITFTFRHMEPSDAIKKYAEGKISRLQKLLLHPMTAKVTLAIEKQRHVAEVQLASGKEHIEAKDSGAELYASIDLVVDKLERQINENKGGKIARHRRPGESVRTSTPPEQLDVPDAEELTAKKRAIRSNVED
jgi:putative sigma-54 modulation protein